MRCRLIGKSGLRSNPFETPPTNPVLPPRYEISHPTTQDGADSAWDAAERQVREAGNSTVVSVKSERSKTKKRKVDDQDGDGDEGGEVRKEKRKRGKEHQGKSGRDGEGKKHKSKGDKDGERREKAKA